MTKTAGKKKRKSLVGWVLNWAWNDKINFIPFMLIDPREEGSSYKSWKKVRITIEEI